MKFESKKSVESYERAVTLTDEQKYRDNMEPFFAELVREEKVDVNKYFSKEQLEILKKLRINVRTNKIHTLFEIAALQADLMLYYPQHGSKFADLKLPPDVSQESFNSILEVMKQIILDCKK